MQKAIGTTINCFAAADVFKDKFRASNVLYSTVDPIAKYLSQIPMLECLLFVFDILLFNGVIVYSNVRTYQSPWAVQHV